MTKSKAISFWIFCVLLLVGSSAHAQSFRIGDSYPISSSLTAPGVISTLQATISICNFPANSVPCTNKATTYSSVTLRTPCPTSTQVVLTRTNTCVAQSDARGNWGAWVPTGNYDSTVTISTGQSFGPYTVSVGIPAGSTITGPITISGAGTVTGAQNANGGDRLNGTFTGPTTLTGNVTATAGQNSFALFNLNNIIYVDGIKYANLAAALTACGSGTCWIIDTLPETFNANPFASFSGNGCRVDFGAGLWTLNAQVIVPVRCTANGAGRGDDNPSTMNTIFKAGGSFPINMAMFRLGVGSTFEQGVRLENLAMDCNNVTGCQGVYSNSVNEEGGLFRVKIANNLGHCALFDMAAGSNFAENFSLNDVECFPTATSTSVHGIYLRGAASFAGVGPKLVSNITVVGIGVSVLGDAVRAENITGGSFIGLHGEKVTTVFHCAANTLGSRALSIENVVGTSTSTGTNVALIDSGCNDIDLRNIIRGNGTTFTNTIQDNASSPTVTVVGTNNFTGQTFSTGYYHAGPVFLNGLVTSNAAVRAIQQIADQGTACTNGELALSAGWQSTGSATVTAVAGNGQTCSWTITTGTTTAANPTVTDTLTNALPAATTVCELNIHGGTHTAAAGEGFQQTTLSATAPVFTFNGTPTAGGTTYFVTRRCGP